jgi:hypothetical protein
MDRAGGYHVKQNKPDTERQVSHNFCHMWQQQKKMASKQKRNY